MQPKQRKRLEQANGKSGLILYCPANLAVRYFLWVNSRIRSILPLQPDSSFKILLPTFVIKLHQLLFTMPELIFSQTQSFAIHRR